MGPFKKVHKTNINKAVNDKEGKSGKIMVKDNKIEMTAINDLTIRICC